MNYWFFGILIGILTIIAYLARKKASRDLKKPLSTDDPVEYWAIDKNADELNPINCDFYLLVKEKNHERVAILWNKRHLNLSKNDLLVEADESYTGRYKGKTVQLKKFVIEKNADKESLNQKMRKKATEIPDWMTNSTIPPFELNEMKKREIWNPKD